MRRAVIKSIGMTQYSEMRPEDARTDAASSGAEEDPGPRADGILVRVRGTVQGVGFRPTVWRIARELGVAGDVANDAEGVLIRLATTREGASAFAARMTAEAPALARIESIEIRHVQGLPVFEGFIIRPSSAGIVRTLVAPDAATCPQCVSEIHTQTERRYCYPFTNCTNCGPRLTIIERVPYDRTNTSMARFAMCEACQREYQDPEDRRFHAEPIACPLCGPKAQLVDAAAAPAQVEGRDDIAKAVTLIRRGAIIAIKGLGGYHLACDATNPDAVTQLRARKLRFGKPFALMARDIDVVRRYATIGDIEAATVTSAAAPIILLDANGPERLPDAVAPGISGLGFMLPHTPLHHLILRNFDQPLVMTSGNLSDEPPCIDDLEARSRLAALADCFLIHDRQIINRVDDSLVRVVAGAPTHIRRSRGYAPTPINLPDGFAAGADVLAMGGELKNTFCLVREGHAILSQHQGDLENAVTFADFENNLALFTRLFDHDPIAIAVDRHPDYLATKHGRMLAAARGLPVIEVQHHHAHVVACLADNAVPLDAEPVLGIVLDGLGFGDDDTIWGGEFLLANYGGYDRLACLTPVPMPGGAQAVREPWRNLYAHLDAAMGYKTFRAEFGATHLATYLDRKPTATMAAMIAKGLNSPLASSCGRLFDAVGAALGICSDAITYEGEAAARLEALVAASDLARASTADAYPFAQTRRLEAPCACLDPAPMWLRLCQDLHDRISPKEIALRFHLGLAMAVADMAAALASHVKGKRCDTIALSGGCFQNRWLTEEVVRRLQFKGFRVLMHSKVPANDGGLALGQAVTAAGRLLRT